MNVHTALRLGRVANVPTVWTSTFAAIVLITGLADAWITLSLMVATSLAYLGGMFLNDAFDAETDAELRPSRPLPSGETKRSTVFTVGFAMLAGSVAIFGFAGTRADSPSGLQAAAAGLALAGAIVLFDWLHKKSALSMVVMGLCRGLVYIAVALVFTRALPAPLIAAAFATACHVAAVSYVARQETPGQLGPTWPLALFGVPIVYGLLLAVAQPWALISMALFGISLFHSLGVFFRNRAGDTRRAVRSMTAATALIDAAYVAAAGLPLWAGGVAAIYLLVKVLQRVLPEH